MKFYDLTLAVSNQIPSWPGDITYKREERKTSAIVSSINISSHFGTHIDAPKHFLFKKSGVDSLKINSLIGIFDVYEVKSKKLISLADIKKLPINSGDRVLFKTRNSKFINSKKFTANYVSLSIEASQYLASKKVLLVGVDYFGIEAKSAPGHPVHKALLSKDIVIVEGLNLSKIKAGVYDGAILPIKIKNGDGAPCRAILWN